MQAKPMHFEYRERQLYCEDVDLALLAARVGTPCYVYSSGAIREAFGEWARHMGTDRGHLVCYALKANTNQSVISLLARAGAGADVVSAGEMQRALAAGIPPERIIFSGVAKQAEEMRAALGHGIFQFNAESIAELERLDEVARSLGKQAPVALRINPDIDARTHAKISTGLAINKFGIPAAQVLEAGTRIAQLPGLKLQGLAMHIGSQLTELAPFAEAFRGLTELTRALREAGHDIRILDLGGGLGIHYEPTRSAPPTVAEYAALAHRQLGSLGCRLVVEPGRSIVGRAGVLLARVVYVKETRGRRFLIVDAGMNDLLRPSLYDAWHGIEPCRDAGAPLRRYDVVGPVCETGDTFARDRELPEMQAGDLLVFRDTGAYGAVMASSYNTRALVPEVLVDGAGASLVRERIPATALIALDTSMPIDL